MRRWIAAALFICVAAAVVGHAVGRAADAPPYKYSWFYRFVVELVEEGEPLTIEVIIGCGTQERHILGEGRSARAVWGPYIYGVRAKDGHGVLVQSPNVCDRDIARNPVPPDFLPLVLWAPDARNLEFLIAYVNEHAYVQPVSKLRFIRATVTAANEADYEAWRASKWKDNIVPTSPRASDQMRSYFRGQLSLPSGDPRAGVRTECHSFVRIPIPEPYRDRLRGLWPKERPRYWLFDWNEGQNILSHTVAIAAEARRRGLWTTDTIGLPTFYAGSGVKRASGVGYLGTLTAGYASGEALRIPFRTETGYPWASDRLLTQPTIDIHADTKGGADQGFAYCYRDVDGYYLSNRSSNISSAEQISSRDYKMLIDDRIVEVLPNEKYSVKARLVAERDEYLWKDRSFPLQHELGAMQ
jgi:hypothetical protein